MLNLSCERVKCSFCLIKCSLLFLLPQECSRLALIPSKFSSISFQQTADKQVTVSLTLWCLTSGIPILQCDPQTPNDGFT